MPEPINCPGCGNIVLSGDRSAKCLGCEVKAFHAAKKEDTTTTTKGNVQPAPVRGKE